MENENTNDLVNVVKTNYFSARKGTVENPQAVAGAIRSALEGAVKLFWQIKYEKIPVWINGGREEFSLYEAISSVRFTKFFNALEISYMNLIRKMCNDVLHGTVAFTVEIASELLSRLENCIKAIERETGVKIITGGSVPVELILLDKTSLRLCTGEEKLLHATVLPDNATNKAVIWSSSDSSVATVKNGMVIACRKGACTVTATTEDGGFTVNCFISVEPTCIGPWCIGLPLKRDFVKGYGGRALDIYNRLCDPLGWNEKKSYRFGPQQLLYAKEVTPEGYSVWFIAHSNFTGSSGGNWKNVIDGEIIIEYWDLPREGLYDDDIRVTFVKTKGTYVFLGVYNLADIQVMTNANGSRKWIKTYQLIEDVYPVEKGNNL